ncbi:hypothetical protein ACVMYR_28265 [Micromonospora sp. PTRAS2]
MTARYARRMPACAHVDIGSNLLATRDYLMDLISDLSDAYSRSSPEVRAAEQTLRAVDRLRTVLDNSSANELPDDRWAPTIYRGANDDERQADMERVMEAHWADDPTCPCAAGTQRR